MNWALRRPVEPAADPPTLQEAAAHQSLRTAAAHQSLRTAAAHQRPQRVPVHLKPPADVVNIHVYSTTGIRVCVLFLFKDYWTIGTTAK